jgi:hypothetical protein
MGSILDAPFNVLETLGIESSFKKTSNDINKFLVGLNMVGMMRMMTMVMVASVMVGSYGDEEEWKSKAVHDYFY